MTRIKKDFDFVNGFQAVLLAPDERFAVLAEWMSLWEASVRSTHGFLTQGDIVALRPVVRSALTTVPELWGMRDRSGRWVAFMGMAEEGLEMLFVHPAAQGMGLGRQLVLKAVGERGVRFVDVNEQNPAALGFYERMGFTVVGRSETDGQGNPFPLLHMQWEEQSG